MKKIYTLLAALICIGASAQSFTHENFAQPGDQYSVVFLDSTFLYMPTDSGINKIWDFSHLDPISNEIINIGSNDNSPYKDAWCFRKGYTDECDQGYDAIFTQWRDVEVGYQLQQFGVTKASEMIKVWDNRVEARAFGMIIDGVHTTLEYQNPDEIMRFPIEYGLHYTDLSSCNGSLYMYGVPIQIGMTGERTVNADATGTLITPYGTAYNVIRVRTEFHLITNLNYYNVPLQFNGVVYQDAFYNSNYGFPIMLIEYQYDEGMMEVGYIHVLDNLLSIPELNHSTSLYPNPTTGKIYTDKPVKIYNTLGQFVTSKPDLTGFANGVYLVTFEDGQVLRVVKH